MLLVSGCTAYIDAIDGRAMEDSSVIHPHTPTGYVGGIQRLIVRGDDPLQGGNIDQQQYATPRRYTW